MDLIGHHVLGCIKYCPYRPRMGMSGSNIYIEPKTVYRFATAENYKEVA